MPFWMVLVLTVLARPGVVGGTRHARLPASPRVPDAREAPGPRVYAVEPDSSNLFVVTHRTGLLSFLGHEHAIIPLRWTAELCLADPVAAGAHGSLIVETASLVIDSDSARALAHLGGGPGADTRSSIQRKMLDPDHLDAERFPEARLDVVAIDSARDGAVRARATLTLHGVTRTLDLPVKVEAVGSEAIVLRGTLRIRQTDFGIKPESIAAVVKVSNDVDLHFALRAHATSAACAAQSARSTTSGSLRAARRAGR